MKLCIECIQDNKKVEATFTSPDQWCDYHYCIWWCEDAYEDPVQQENFFNNTLQRVQQDTSKLNRMYPRSIHDQRGKQ